MVSPSSVNAASSMALAKEKALGVLAASCALGAFAPAASAVTPTTIEQDLVAADLSPAPLFPSRVPARLRDANSSLKVRRQRFTVTWDRGRGSRGLPIGDMQFGRGPAGQLTDDRRTARNRGYRL